MKDTLIALAWAYGVTMLLAFPVLLPLLRLIRRLWE